MDVSRAWCGIGGILRIALPSIVIASLVSPGLERYRSTKRLLSVPVSASGNDGLSSRKCKLLIGTIWVIGLATSLLFLVAFVIRENGRAVV